MGKFIEVYRTSTNYPILVNVDSISMVYSRANKSNALLLFKDDSEMALQHSYDEVRDALFVVGDKSPVITVNKGDIKDEK